MNIAITTRAATLILALLMAGCMDAFNRIKGSGVAKTETRAVEAFHAVRLNGAADVSITIGQPAQLTVTADDNIVPVIDTDVHDGVLVIGNHESYNTQMGVKVVIVTPSLDAFELNGSGNVKIKELNGEKFSAKIRGSGDLSADGAVNRLDASISGSGDMKLGELKVKSADVSIAGSGSATVNAEESMSASISGSGDIRYKGNPSKVQSSVAGSGSVHKI
jgi:putative autotransporter adhesin-like protein